MAFGSLRDAWPDWAWATKRSLHAGSEVASLALFRGQIRKVTPRKGPYGSRCPTVDLVIADERMDGIPYAAHRLHRDRGVAVLQQLQGQGTLHLLLGLSRVFGCLPEC